MESFGKLLKKQRAAKRITLRVLSEHIGKSISYLSDIENDRKGPPNLEIVRKIEEYLEAKNDVLVKLASKLRGTIRKDIANIIKTKPQLSELLLRADDLTEEEIEKLMSDMESITKERES